MKLVLVVVGGVSVALIVWLQRVLRDRPQPPVTERWRNEHVYGKHGDHHW